MRRLSGNLPITRLFPARNMRVIAFGDRPVIAPSVQNWKQSFSPQECFVILSFLFFSSVTITAPFSSRQRPRSLFLPKTSERSLRSGLSPVVFRPICFRLPRTVIPIIFPEELPLTPTNITLFAEPIGPKHQPMVNGLIRLQPSFWFG